MENGNAGKPSLHDAILYFAEYQHCHDFMVSLRWPEGKVACPVCGSEKVTYLAKQRVWKCYQPHPKPRFTLKTGTIFEDSPIGLEKWLPAVWMLLNCKNVMSSWELHRAIGVTQKTAWFMLHRIRLAAQNKGFTKLQGEVEVDETFIGGKSRNMHSEARKRKVGGRGTGGKEIVFGMVERGGTIRAIHTDGRGKPELQRNIREHVQAGSAIFSDELHSYDGLSPEYKHEVINHAVEYVHGNIHTNTMENFWALLKRSLHGTYVSVEAFHLFRYLDEQTFRYNNRDMDDVHRFTLGMRGIVGRRLTYAELTGKLEDICHG